jgi:hypothetical protein
VRGSFGQRGRRINTRMFCTAAEVIICGEKGPIPIARYVGDDIGTGKTPRNNNFWKNSLYRAV